MNWVGLFVFYCVTQSDAGFQCHAKRIQISVFTASVTTRSSVNLNIWLQLVMSEFVSFITPNLLDSNKLMSVFNTQKYCLIESLLLKLFLHARFPLWHPQRDSTFFLIFRAHSLDPDDSEVLFHLALCQALMRQVNFMYLSTIVYDCLSFPPIKTAPDLNASPELLPLVFPRL